MDQPGVVAKTSVLKKVLIGMGAFLGLLLVSLIVIPLVVNVDQYRPQILQIANERLNGKLDIGKLSLSLWGKIEIDIDGITLTDTSGNQLVSVKETYAHIALLSFLKGQPRLIFKMDRPDLKIVKDKSGKLNLLNLVKPAPPGQPVTSAPSSEPTSNPNAPAEKGEIPMISLIAAAGVDVELINAQLNFRDLSSGFTQDVKDFNLILQDISMSRPMNVVSFADIKTSVGDTVQIAGPFRLDGVITPQFNGSEFQKADINLDVGMSDLTIDVGNTFSKAKGIPFIIKTNISAAANELNIEKLLLNFHNAILELSLRVNDLQNVSPGIDLNLSSNPIDLSSWDKLVPALNAFDLEGRMDLKAKAKGPTSKLEYNAQLDVIDIVANTPGLQAKPKMQVHVDLETNFLKKAAFNLESPGTDLAVLATVKSFTAPVVNVNIDSRGIDLDQLLPPPPPTPSAPANSGAGAGKGSESSNSNSASTPASKEPATDVDKSLEPLRNNQMLRALLASVKVRIGKFKGFKVEADNIAVDFSLKQLLATLERFELGVFGGKVKANAGVDLKPPMPTYNMKLDVSNIDMKTAVASTVESLKNTMFGKLSLGGAGSGRSLNSDKILTNLSLAGNFKIADAEFATIDVGAMVAQAINEAVQKLVEKIPPLKDKKVENLNNYKSRYQTVSSDFTLKNGVFLAPNFKTVSYKNQGIDLEGRTEVDLVNDKLKADWYVIDTYNATKAQDVNIDMSGVKVEHVLAEKGKPVGFPIKVGCKMSAPCYDYKSVPDHFTKIALANSKQVVSGRLKEETKKVEKQAKEELKKHEKKIKGEAEKKLKDKAKEALKGFGF